LEIIGFIEGEVRFNKSSILLRIRSASFAKESFEPTPVRTPIERPTPADLPMRISAKVSPMTKVWLGETLSWEQIFRALAGLGLGTFSLSSPQTTWSTRAVTFKAFIVSRVTWRLSAVQIAIFTPFSFSLEKSPLTSPTEMKKLLSISVFDTQFSIMLFASVQRNPSACRTSASFFLMIGMVLHARRPVSSTFLLSLKYPTVLNILSARFFLAALSISAAHLSIQVVQALKETRVPSLSKMMREGVSVMCFDDIARFPTFPTKNLDDGIAFL